MTEVTGAPPTADPIALIAEHLGAIRGVLEAGHEASERARAEARASLDAARIARETAAGRAKSAAPSPDFHPFASMPPGTTVRGLPGGGRIFLLADGVFVRVNALGEIAVVTDTGEVSVPAPARGGQLRLPDGRELAMKPEALRVTHEAAGISGLPASVDPIRVAEGRYSVTLPDGTRLEVSHPDRLATVVTRIGTVVVLGASKLEAIGESLDVRLVPGDRKSFRSSESRIGGVLDADGALHAAMPSGEDLVVRFPAVVLPELPSQTTEPFTFCGRKRS